MARDSRQMEGKSSISPLSVRSLEVKSNSNFSTSPQHALTRADAELPGEAFGHVSAPGGSGRLGPRPGRERLGQRPAGPALTWAGELPPAPCCTQGRREGGLADSEHAGRQRARRRLLAAGQPQAGPRGPWGTGAASPFPRPLPGGQVALGASPSGPPRPARCPPPRWRAAPRPAMRRERLPHQRWRRPRPAPASLAAASRAHARAALWRERLYGGGRWRGGASGGREGLWGIAARHFCRRCWGSGAAMVRAGRDRRVPSTPRPPGQPSLPSSPCSPGHWGREGRGLRCGPGRAGARFGGAGPDGAGAQRRQRRSGSGAL